MKDRFSAGLNFQLSRLDRFSLEQFSERYALQTARRLVAGSTPPSSSPTHCARKAAISNSALSGQPHRFSREDSYSDAALLPLLPASIANLGELRPDFFLPENFNFYGLRLSTDMRYEREYTRAIRPYASLSRTWHSELGPGYDVRLAWPAACSAPTISA